MKDLSRQVRKLRRKVYRQMPVATCSCIAELDQRMSFADMTATLEQGNLGVLSEGAALALWRACDERQLPAWCYEFGFPQSLTHTVTIVEIDGVLQVHDAFFNLSYPLGLDDLLGSLRAGNAVNGKREVRDRKIYIADPAGELEQTLQWLAVHADRELEPIGGLRRFELLWNPEAFTATCPRIPGVSRDLTSRGYPGDLQFLMLHPVAVFDGENQHRDRSSMPLVGGRDLRSPVAELRVATRDLDAERAKSAEKTAKIVRLETELTEANSWVTELAGIRDEAEAGLSEISGLLSAEREAWLQQKVTLQASRSALEGELSETRVRLSAAIDLRAQRDSQIAQLRAEIEDARREFDAQRKAVLALESERTVWEASRLRRDGENRDLTMRLDAAARENEQLRGRVTLLESEVGAAQQHAIEITHYIAPLIEELNQMRQSVAVEREAAAQDKAMLETEVSELKARITEAGTRAAALEAKLAASPGARLSALWRRFTTGCALLFRSDKARIYAVGTSAKGLEGVSDSKVRMSKGPDNASP